MFSQQLSLALFRNCSDFMAIWFSVVLCCTHVSYMPNEVLEIGILSKVTFFSFYGSPNIPTELQGLHTVDVFTILPLI